MPILDVVKVHTWSGIVQAGDNAQPRTNSQGTTATEPPKRNRFYALNGRNKQGKSADMVTGMLQVISTFDFSLLDPGFTLSFLTSLLALTFEILPEVMHDPTLDSTSLGENVRIDWVYKDCLIFVCGKTICAELIELPMHDFDVILGMDSLYSFYACMDCRIRVVRFHIPIEK